MALLSRIYFNAVFGALGGLSGWLLFGVFGDQTAPADRVTAQLALGGALIGGSIGYFLVGADALRDGSLLRFARTGTYGLVLGAVGGALGMTLGDFAHGPLLSWLGGAGTRGALTQLLGAMAARGFGWMLLGAAVGVSEGVASRSLGKLSYGALGGTLGGLVGGGLFGLAAELAREGAGLGAFWSALGLVVLGASIGALSALVQGVFQPAAVRVLRGWQEGRVYSLSRVENLLGRDEHADVALFRDRRVEKRHVFIRLVGRRYLLVNNQAPPDQTLVNGEPVADRRELRDGDRIELGGVVLRFQHKMRNGPPNRVSG